MQNFSLKPNNFSTLLFTISFHLVIISAKTNCIINKPIIDLRTQPTESITPQKNGILSNAAFYSDNPNQYSQILFGKKVHILDEQSINDEEWINVLALNQKKYRNDKWAFQKESIDIIPKEYFYSKNSVTNKMVIVNNTDAKIYINGKKIPVSIGTKLNAIEITDKWTTICLAFGEKAKIKTLNINIISKLNKTNIRENITRTAKLFLNSPYSWGGRSLFTTKSKMISFEQQAGVDSSAFINLIFNTIGYEIPRNVNDQKLFCKEIRSGEELKKGDFIFFESSRSPGKMNHVMLYLGDNKIQESFGVMMLDNIKRNKFYGNRITTIEKKFGINSVKNLKTGKPDNKNHIIHLGTILGSKKRRKTARQNFLNK